MKRLLTIASVLSISLTVFAKPLSPYPKHRSNDCPNFAGTFTNSEGVQMKVTQVDIPNGVSYTFGDGTEPVMADGTIHVQKDGTHYLGYCSDSVTKNVFNDNYEFTDGSFTLMRLPSDGDGFGSLGANPVKWKKVDSKAGMTDCSDKATLDLVERYYDAIDKHKDKFAESIKKVITTKGCGALVSR
ncbi:MAG: hypothetical protein A4S09_02235 [Proteobacteria bacterium SG_bin7]|nr:MAG: hypothetical protein A4S09_02235 [Proteobacteria bacterium SG_bin7]